MKKLMMKIIAQLMQLWSKEEKAGKARTVKREQQDAVAVKLTERVNRFLTATYDFRYNLLTEETEYRAAGAVGEPFSPVGKRELNTFCLQAHARGIPCWDKDINRYLYSTCVPSYHPFRLYLDELPDWDGVDRLEPLARRVSSDPLWIEGFHRWMLALIAQWMGITGRHANSVAPVLVSASQGCLKSTFCKCLMPETLNRYYTDDVELTSQGKVARKMSEMGLMNLDEFDKYSAAKMPLLKNLMQMADLNICKAYQKNYRNLPRIASFIATSNRFDLLTDPTGSRRFLCVEVTGKIDCSRIGHKQVYAQLKRELRDGARYWFTAEEEEELQRHNEAFQRRSLTDDLLCRLFRPAEANDSQENILRLTAADLFKILKQYNSAAMRGVSPNWFAQSLTPAGFVRVRGHYGNYYPVVRLNTPSAI